MKSNSVRTVEVYEQLQMNAVLGERLHPGGVVLSQRLIDVCEIQNGMRILELGSGQGYLLEMLSQQGNCLALGMDLSMLQLRAALKRSNVTKSGPVLSLLCADAQRSPYRSGLFDVILSECVFSLLAEKQEMVQQIARLLAPEGVFGMTDVFLRGNISADLRAELGFTCCFSEAKSRSAYEQLFGQAGFRLCLFEDHSIELKRITYKVAAGYGSLTAFWRQFGQGAAPCCAPSATAQSGSKSWRKLFKEGKPGYGLFLFTKAA